MDPLTIATTVLGIAGKCVSVARDLSALRDKYLHASLTISAICSESAVVNAALCKLQGLFSDQHYEAFLRFQSRPELAAACDTALTGCTLLYSCLDDEVQSLRIQATASAPAELTWTQKSKSIWKEATMKELLQQIRGQTSALNLLLQCFHFEQALETRQLLTSQAEALTQIKANMSVLRSTYPSKRSMPESILGDTRSIQAVFADNASIIGDAEFSFDDIIVNSRAYRQAMAAAMSYAKDRASSQRAAPDDSPTGSVRSQDGETITDGKTAGDGPSFNTVPQDRALRNGVAQDSSGPAARRRADGRVIRALALPSSSMGAAELVHAVRQEPVRWEQLLEFEGLSKEDLLEVPTKLVEFQNFWMELLTSEQDYITTLQVTKTIFADQILLRWPKVVQDPGRFVDVVFGSIDSLLAAHIEHLYQPLVQHWAIHGAWTPFSPEPFHRLLDQVSPVLLQFCGNFVRARRTVEMECELNPQFGEFLKKQRAHPSAMRLDWDFFHKAPITRLLRYCLLLGTLSNVNRKLPLGFKRSPESTAMNDVHSDQQINQLIERFQQLAMACDNLLDEGKNDVDRVNLSIRFKPREYLTRVPADLSWLPPGAKIRFQMTAFCKDSYDDLEHLDWSWYDLFVTDKYIVVAERWKWTTPREHHKEQDGTLCALSVKTTIDAKFGYFYLGMITSRRRMFGLFPRSLPREVGESVVFITYRGETAFDVKELVVSGNINNLSGLVACVNSVRAEDSS